MKKKYFLLVLILVLTIFLVGCNGIMTPVMEDISFENRTANTLSVQITSTYIETNIDSFTIEPDSTKTIRSEYGIIPVFVVSVIEQPSLKVRYSKYNYSSKVVFWNTYEYEVEYKISGTATSVDITLSNSSGGD